MRTWMPLWFFPLGLLGALVLLAVNSLVGDVLVLVWGFVLVPHGAALMVRRSPGGSDHFRDLETQYWRLGGR